MTVTDELKDRFDGLNDEEKIAFIKSVMPSLCARCSARIERR